MILTLLGVLGLVLAVVWLAAGPYGLALFHWASARQHGVQDAMAGSLRAIRGGDWRALAGLCALSGAYGFLHAAGPGHGKVLLGSTAMAGGVALPRMLAIGLAASLAQSVVAILLVTLGAGLLMLSTGGSALADGVLAEASRWIIAAIGALIAWRGARGLWRVRGAVPPADRHRHHDHDADCGHAHGPSVAQVAALRSPAEMAALILGIAIRPCTGALFLMAIALHLGIPLAGVLGTLAMGLGTAGFNAMAIAGGTALSRAPRLERWLGGGAGAETLGAGLQLAAGLVVIILTLGLAL